MYAVAPIVLPEPRFCPRWHDREESVMMHAQKGNSPDAKPCAIDPPECPPP